MPSNIFIYLLFGLLNLRIQKFVLELSFCLMNLAEEVTFS